MHFSKTKTPAFALTALVMVGLLSGCTAGGEQNTPSPTPSATETSFAPVGVDSVPTNAPGIDSLPTDDYSWDLVEEENYYQLNSLAETEKVAGIDTWFGETFSDEEVVVEESQNGIVTKKVDNVDGFNVLYTVTEADAENKISYITILFTEVE